MTLELIMTCQAHGVNISSPEGRRHSRRRKTTFRIEDDDIPVSGRQHLHDGWRTTFQVTEDDLPNTRGRQPSGLWKTTSQTNQRKLTELSWKTTFQYRSIYLGCRVKTPFDKSKYDLTSGLEGSGPQPRLVPMSATLAA